MSARRQRHLLPGKRGRDGQDDAGSERQSEGEFRTADADADADTDTGGELGRDRR
jgi:hypothetical protein